jgi:hypothetical protein
MKKKLIKKPARYKFWLNIYADMAFTRCPQCENTTKVKKLPLVVAIELSKRAILNINMTTKYCPYCDLIIAKADEITGYASTTLGIPVKTGEYNVLGTLDRKDWVAANNTQTASHEFFDSIYPFKKTLTFTILPAGWYKDDE